MEDGDIDGVRKNLQRYHYTVAASLDRAAEKIGCHFPEEKLEELRGLADVLLIEADGAKRLPLKVPGEREPVIPEFAGDGLSELLVWMLSESQSRRPATDRRKLRISLEKGWKKWLQRMIS